MPSSGYETLTTSTGHPAIFTLNALAITISRQAGCPTFGLGGMLRTPAWYNGLTVTFTATREDASTCVRTVILPSPFIVQVGRPTVIEWVVAWAPTARAGRLSGHARG